MIKQPLQVACLNSEEDMFFLCKMADLADVQICDDPDPDEENDQTTTMKCCRTRKCTVVVCVNCYAVFHRSCIERSTNIVFIRKGQVMCCSSTATANTDSGSEKENGILRELIN